MATCLQLVSENNLATWQHVYSCFWISWTAVL